MLNQVTGYDERLRLRCSGTLSCLFTQNAQHSPAGAALPLIFNHEGAAAAPAAHGSLDTIGFSSSLTDKMTHFSG